MSDLQEMKNGQVMLVPVPKCDERYIETSPEETAGERAEKKANEKVAKAMRATKANAMVRDPKSYEARLYRILIPRKLKPVEREITMLCLEGHRLDWFVGEGAVGQCDECGEDKGYGTKVFFCAGRNHLCCMECASRRPASQLVGRLPTG